MSPTKPPVTSSVPMAGGIKNTLSITRMPPVMETWLSVLKPVQVITPTIKTQTENLIEPRTISGMHTTRKSSIGDTLWWSNAKWSAIYASRHINSGNAPTTTARTHHTYDGPWSRWAPATRYCFRIVSVVRHQTMKVDVRRTIFTTTANASRKQIMSAKRLTIRRIEKRRVVYISSVRASPPALSRTHPDSRTRKGGSPWIDHHVTAWVCLGRSGRH